MPPSSKRRADRRVDGGIIDVHSHALLPVWRDALAKATGQSKDNILIAGVLAPAWSVESHLAMMDAHCIAACALSWPGATSFLKGAAARDLARAMNEEFASIIARHPSRFGAFAVLPLDDMDAAAAEMVYALDVLKLDGVSSPTNIASIYLGDAQFDGWFAEMNRRGTTIFVHPTASANSQQVGLGIHPAILEYMFDSTRMATNMVLSGTKKRFANVRVICTHGGGTIPYLAPRISILEPWFGTGPGRSMLSGEEVLEGLSSFYFDLTASTAASSLDAIRHLVPSSRLACGFDYPMMPMGSLETAKKELESYSGFTDEDHDNVRRATALQLLPRLADRIG
jgi:predicted TIM-barrel fold metal-dependent hydrolase